MYKVLFILMIIINPAFGIAQSGHIPPNKEKCTQLTDTMELFHGQISFYDTLIQDRIYRANYMEADSFRLIYTDTCPFIEFYRKGIINPYILHKANCTRATFEDIQIEQPHLICFGNDGYIDNWNSYYISSGYKEITDLATDTTRVFELGTYNIDEDGGIFYYLEFTNPNATKDTPIDEFMKGAFISCFIKWYNRI